MIDLGVHYIDRDRVFAHIPFPTSDAVIYLKVRAEMKDVVLALIDSYFNKEVENYMPFQFERKPRPEGEYVSMTDVKKLGEPLNVVEVLDDQDNTYGGEKQPRFLLRGTIGDSDKVVLVPVRKGYSRDDFVIALADHIENTDEVVQVKFVSTKGSNYIDVVTA